MEKQLANWSISRGTLSSNEVFVSQSDGIRYTPPCVSRAVHKFACSHNKARNTKQMKIFISSVMWFVKEIALGVRSKMKIFTSSLMLVCKGNGSGCRCFTDSVNRATADSDTRNASCLR